MKVPLLDLHAQLEPIKSDIEKSVLGVIHSGRYIGGPEIDALEKEVAEYSGAKHGIGVSSGTDALLVALMAYDIQPGDIVVTTPYSFFATAGVVSRLNAIPAFVDIESDSYNMDPVKLEAWLTNCPPRDLAKVKAIVPVHLYGQCADMEAICKLAAKHNIPVIEDAAQAIGSGFVDSDGKEASAGSIGDIGCFSFFPSKNLGGLGDGGMVVTNDDDLAEKIRRLKNHGAKPKYYHSMIGGNFRLDAIQAAPLRVKLKHLNAWSKARQENAEYYDANLNITGVVKPTVKYRRQDHIYNQYVISVPEKRDGLRAYLQANDIGCEVYYPVPFHRQECFKDLGLKEGDFPNAEHAADHTLAIPIYPELTNEMQDYVIQKIGEFYE